MESAAEQTEKHCSQPLVSGRLCILIFSNPLSGVEIEIITRTLLVSFKHVLLHVHVCLQAINQRTK